MLIKCLLSFPKLYLKKKIILINKKYNNNNNNNNNNNKPKTEFFKYSNEVKTAESLTCSTTN